MLSQSSCPNPARLPSRPHHLRARWADRILQHIRNGALWRSLPALQGTSSHLTCQPVEPSGALPVPGSHAASRTRRHAVTITNGPQQGDPREAQRGGKHREPGFRPGRQKRQYKQKKQVAVSKRLLSNSEPWSSLVSHSHPPFLGMQALFVESKPMLMGSPYAIMNHVSGRCGRGGPFGNEIHLVPICTCEEILTCFVHRLRSEQPRNQWSPPLKISAA